MVGSAAAGGEIAVADLEIDRVNRWVRRSGQRLQLTACEFDVPARFDTDTLGLRLDAFEIGAIPDIPVLEIRE